LERREALRLLAVGAALPALHGELFRVFQDVHASLPASRSMKAFTQHQDATVSAIAEMIIPETETPGARTARVNEFIDLIVASWYSDEERARFLSGLAGVDARTQAFFAKDFVDAMPAQQADILTALGEEMARDARAVANDPRGYRGGTPEPGHNFYYMLRQLVFTGYFTSEAGATKQLHLQIVPGRFDGCTPVAPTAGGEGA